MEDIDSNVMLKEKLLSAGIDEIATYGTQNFSLRRVAAACGASCAAPYKHFKNKEHFINEIILYVEEKWLHLSNQILAVTDDPKERIAELCVANIRFKVGNPLFGVGKDCFDPVISKELSLFCQQNQYDYEEKLFVISALVTGTATLIVEGKMDSNPKTFRILKTIVLNELENKAASL